MLIGPLQYHHTWVVTTLQWRDWRTAFAVPFIRQQLHLTLLLRKTQILLRHNEKSTLVVCRRRNRIPEDGL